MFTSWFVLLNCLLPLVWTYHTVPEVLYSKAAGSSLNSIQQVDQDGSGNYVQKCKTPAGQNGQCVPLESCVIQGDQFGNFSSKDYACVLNNQSGIGVCCPDHMGTSVQNQKEVSNRVPKKKRLPRSPKTESAKQKDEVMSETDEAANNVNTLDQGYSLGDYKACGRSGKTSSRTKAEAPTSIGDWPWMVVFINKKTKAQFCGGTLITKRHILTAAHCFLSSEDPKDFLLVVGGYNLSSISQRKGIFFEVEKIFIHEGFDGGNNLQDDIAIVKMKRPTTYNSYVQPCCLPAPGAEYANFPATVTGWGTLGSNKSSSDTLMEVQVPVWELKNCEDNYPGKIFKTNLCAGESEGGKDACQGDSGGPLTLQRQDGRWVIVGVVSWGQDCGLKNRPGVYTKVNDYLQWIDCTLKTDKEC